MVAEEEGADRAAGRVPAERRGLSAAPSRLRRRRPAARRRTPVRAIPRLEPVVTLHGWQPTAAIQACCGDSDVFVQHSILDPETGDEEGLPVAVLEAMAAGLPVVATRHGGIPEAVVAETTGALVGEGDVTEMAAQVVRLAADPDLRSRFGRAAWQRVREHYTWEAERRALLEIMRFQIA
jgi:glycosyltransferase involved in cell wall biosynthesis